MRKDIEKIVFNAIRKIKNIQNKKISKISLNTNIYGEKGNFDSLGLVNLIVEIEDKVYKKFNKKIVLADEKAMSRKHSPFKDVQSLVNYIENLLK
jgi:acyl carrier protein